MMLSPRFEMPVLPSWPLSRSQRSARDRLKERLLVGDYPLEAVPCFCGSRAAIPIAAGERWGLPLTTVLCSRCGLMRSSPRMTAAATERFYREDFQDLFFTEEERSSTVRQEKALGQQIAHGSRLLGLLRPVLASIRTVYEVGCGAGGNLVPFAGNGKVVAGCDLGGDMLDLGRAQGLDLIRGSATDLLRHRGEPADLVLLIHVVEHFRDLRAELTQVKQLVRPGGLILIEVPGIGCIETSYQGNLLSYLQLPHNFHFTHATLSYVLSHCGLEPAAMTGDIVAIACRRPDGAATPRPPAPPATEARAVLQHLGEVEKRWMSRQARRALSRPEVADQS